MMKFKNILPKLKITLLNKGGFALAEVFFAFIIMLIIGVMLINFYSVKEDSDHIYDSATNDMYNNMIAVNNALLYTSTTQRNQIELTKYVNVKPIDTPNEVHFFNNVKNNFIENDSKRYRVINPLILNYISSYSFKDEINNEYQQTVSLEKPVGVKLKPRFVNNIVTILEKDKGKHTSNGIYRVVEKEEVYQRLKDLATISEVEYYDSMEMMVYEMEY